MGAKVTVLVAAARCAAGKEDSDAHYARMIAAQIRKNPRFNVIVDGAATFGKTTQGIGIDIALVPHGNRHLQHHNKRMAYIDGLCKNVWCIMSTPLLEYIIFDREGYSGGNTLALNPEVLDVDSVLEKNAEETFAHLNRVYVSSNRSKYKQPRPSDFNAARPFILFLGQVSGDTAVNFSHFKVPGFDTSAHYLKALLTAFQILDTWGIPIIYKTHPREASGHNALVNELFSGTLFKNVTVSQDVSIHDLFPQALGVISINSGAGFEALLHLKPVVTLGAVDYSRGTLNCKTVEDIRAAREYIEHPPSPMQTKKFLHAYLATRYPTHGDDTFLKLTEHLLNLAPNGGDGVIYFLGRKGWNHRCVERGYGRH